MQREKYEDAHTCELFYRVRNEDGSLTGRRRVELDPSERSGLSSRGASKHVTALRFSLHDDEFEGDVWSWVPEELHVHRTVEVASIRDDNEEERTKVFEVAEYQTNEDGLRVKFVPQKPVR